MKISKQIQPLVNDRLVDNVNNRLMSGKEADVYDVHCCSNVRCDKVYKDAVKRSFKQAIPYNRND